MGFLDAFKKDKNVPPEVGEEDKFEAENQKDEEEAQSNEEVSEESDEGLEEAPPKPSKSFSFLPKDVLERVKSKGQTDKTQVLQDIKNEAEESSQPAQTNLLRNVQPSSVSAASSDLAIAKINARLEEIKMRDEQINMRLSRINESIGEIRSMTMNNEKRILSSMKEANKVIDIFSEVKPDKLRLDYQKLEMRLRTLEEKIGAHKNIVDSVVNEFKNLRKRADAFLGTEGLIKLNEDVKKDLIDIQRLVEKSRMHAETTKDIFLELKPNFEENQKVGTLMSNLNEEFSDFKAEVEKLRIRSQNIVKRSEYEDFKKTFGNKIAVVDNLAPRIDRLNDEQQEIIGLVEDCFALAKRNSDDVANVSLKVGDSNSKGMEDYEARLADILDILESLVDEINKFKEKSDNTPQNELKEKMELLKENVNSEMNEEKAEAQDNEFVEEESAVNSENSESNEPEEIHASRKKLKKTSKISALKSRKSSKKKSSKKTSKRSSGKKSKKSSGKKVSKSKTKKKKKTKTKQKKQSKKKDKIIISPNKSIKKKIKNVVRKAIPKKIQPAQNLKSIATEKLIQKLNSPKGADKTNVEAEVAPAQPEKNNEAQPTTEVQPQSTEVQSSAEEVSTPPLTNETPIEETPETPIEETPVEQTPVDNNETSNIEEPLSLPSDIDVEPPQEKPGLKDKIFGLLGKKEEEL